jgi:phage host-nuclease inhibitor protein Gam
MSEHAPTDLADHLAAEYSDPPPIGDPDREAWRIDSDGEASWALRKLATYQAELARLVEQAEGEQARIDDWLADSTSGLHSQIEFFTDHLNDWHHRLVDERGADDMPQTYRLVNGSLVRRKAPDGVNITDADAFVAWALAEGRIDLLNIKPAAQPMRSEVGLGWQVPAMVVDGKGKPVRAEYGNLHPVVTAGGEVVPGVEYRVGAEGYNVKGASRD